jgi:hypothetical protein
VQTISSTASGVAIPPLNKRWIDDPRKRANVKSHAPLGWAAKAGVFPFFTLPDGGAALDPNADGTGPFRCSIHLDPFLGSEGIRDLAVLPSTNEVLRRFNRETELLATGILGALICAALVLATLIQGGQPKAVDQAKEERQTGGNALVNANLDTLCKAVGLNAASSTGEITSGQATSVDLGFTSPRETRFPQIEIAAAIQIPGAGNPTTPEEAEANEIRHAQEIDSEY